MSLDNVSQEIIIILLIIALIALIVGFFIGKAVSSGNKGNSAEKIENEQLKQELEEYKSSVSQHFGKTADLIDNLTQSYKEVFDHLGSNAKTLLSEEEVKHHIESRAAKAITLSYTINAKDAKAPDSDDEKATTNNTDESQE